MFLERHVDLVLFGGDYYKTDAVNGNDSMYIDMDNFGLNDSFSSIFPDTYYRNPDDAFSEVPYEKGFQFLTYLEFLIGNNSMQLLMNEA